MKLRYLLCLGAGFAFACSNAGGEVEVKGGFDAAGFYLVEGEEQLLALVQNGETLMIEGPDFRVPLSSDPESLAPAIGVFQGDRLDLVAVASDGERKLGTLLMAEVHAPEAWLSSSDEQSVSLAEEDEVEIGRSSSRLTGPCEPGREERACSIICCRPPLTIRTIARSICIGGQWVRSGEERACCSGNICAT